MSFRLRFQSERFILESSQLPFVELYDLYRSLDRLKWTDDLTENRETGSGRRIRLRLDPFSQTRPVTLVSRSQARITTVDSDGIALYARMSKKEYLRLCCVVAITQLSAIALSANLEPEDLSCFCQSPCLFSWQDSLRDYAFIFEQRGFCCGCQDFYHALGADHELLAVRELIASL